MSTAAAFTSVPAILSLRLSLLLLSHCDFCCCFLTATFAAALSLLLLRLSLLLPPPHCDFHCCFDFCCCSLTVAAALSLLLWIPSRCCFDFQCCCCGGFSVLLLWFSLLLPSPNNCQQPMDEPEPLCSELLLLCRWGRLLCTRRQKMALLRLQDC